MGQWRTVVTGARARLGEALFLRVAGPDGPATRDRIHLTPGPRWFGPDHPVRRVHADAALFVGGISALLLQSLHPLAMAAVARHSAYREDPWGRLQSISTFLAFTTFGTADDAQRAVDRVIAVHRTVRGRAPGGEPYAATDPALLAWVHDAELSCFLRSHQQYGACPLSGPDQDAYVAGMALVGAALGVTDPPRTVAELAARIEEHRPRLRGTPEAREAARFILRHPPLPWALRLPYAALAAGAVVLLPDWARAELGLPRRLPLERWWVRPAARAAVRLVRWSLPPAPVPAWAAGRPTP
ncbi:oxygenase MpaB family protein [Streptomyces sp. NPDC048357]|uniref:oxygenase MpaB family protein n=1 Tax=Streptomyces sp. NPDC048357 TaxID=3154719 RepID=UPI003415E2C7